MKNRKSRNWIGMGPHPNLNAFREEMRDLHRILIAKPINGRIFFRTDISFEVSTMNEVAHAHNVRIIPNDTGYGGNKTPTERKRIRNAGKKRKGK